MLPNVHGILVGPRGAGAVRISVCDARGYGVKPERKAEDLEKQDRATGWAPSGRGYADFPLGRTRAALPNDYTGISVKRATRQDGFDPHEKALCVWAIQIQSRLRRAHLISVVITLPGVRQCRQDAILKGGKVTLFVNFVREARPVEMN